MHFFLSVPPKISAQKKQQLSVPNLCPFKKELLKKALRRRADLKLELEEKKRLKLERGRDLRKAVANCTRDREKRFKEIDKGLRTPKSFKNTSWNGTELKLPGLNFHFPTHPCAPIPFTFSAST